jgi:hypothetical protein
VQVSLAARLSSWTVAVGVDLEILIWLLIGFEWVISNWFRGCSNTPGSV